MTNQRMSPLSGIAVLLLTKLVAAQPAPPATAPGAPATQEWEQTDQRLVFLTVELSSTEASLAAVGKAILLSGYQRNVKTDATDSYRLGSELMDRKGGGPVPWDQFYGSTARSFYIPSAVGTYQKVKGGEKVTRGLSLPCLRTVK